MRILYLILISCILCMLPALAFAAHCVTTCKPSSQKENTKEDQKQNSDFIFSGYIEGSYNYLLHGNTFTSGVFDRYNDINENGFTLQQASITLAYQPKEGLGGLLNPIAGSEAYPLAPYGWNPDYGSQWFGFTIPEAYLQYATGPLTILGGSFFTLAGAEYSDPTKDTNFSASLLAGFAEPTTNFGLRSKYVVNDKLTLFLGLNNGWDNIADTGRRKTIELGVEYKPHPAFAFNIYGYSGGQRAQEKTATGPQSIRNYVDIVAILNATDKLTFIVNFDYGIQPIAALPENNFAEGVWIGIAGYANYQFNDIWQISLRGEVFNDRNGYRTGVAQCLKEVTLTLGYKPIKHVELRVETRRDISNVNSFTRINSNGTSNNQQSFSLEAVYSFA